MTADLLTPAPGEKHYSVTRYIHACHADNKIYEGSLKNNEI